jgi:hypothetical protein
MRIILTVGIIVRLTFPKSSLTSDVVVIFPLFPRKGKNV